VLREEHQRELSHLRDEITAEIGQTVLAEARHLAAQEQQTVIESLRAELAGERETTVEAVRAAMAAEREAGEQALRGELLAERETSERALRDSLLAEREAAEQSMRQALVSDYQERLEEARAQQEAAPGTRPAGNDRILAAFRRLDRASSLTDALGAVLDHGAAECGRAAIFLVAGERARGWRQAGFDGGAVIEIDLALHEAGPIGLAVQTADPVSTGEYREEESSLPGWLHPVPGSTGLAMPIAVGGRVVAVLYAAPGPETASAGDGTWAETIEILARHAGRCLEVLTFSRAAATPASVDRAPHAAADVRRSEADGLSDSMRQEESARRYARLLISELKLYNETAVEEGRRSHDLLARLGPEVERARRLYEEKIPAVVRERASWFDEELVRTLAGGDASMLGQVT
jgi:hypothetical protein